MQNGLVIEGLRITTRHDDHAHELVRGVTLHIVPGEILALVGASGSGKSLTCNGAQEVLPPGVSRTAGSVLVDGQPVPPQQLRGRVVASIMQNPRSAFNPVLSMRNHAHETLRAVGRMSDDAEQRIATAFGDAGLEDPEGVLKLFPFEMSGGMLQRVMIALALLSGAPYLFADEPTTDLDLVVQAHILDLLETVVRARKLGVLLVTHDMGVVARLADNVAVMSHGEIIERATTAEIFAHPRHSETQALVAAHLALYPEMA